MKKTMKNAISSLTAKLAALLLAFTCAGTAWGALSGTGTEADPFTIGTLADLQEFRDAVNAGTTYEGKYVKLTADIDLDNAKWTPIASNGDSTKFGGTFDGDSHTISNFYIDETTPVYHATGFFGAINGTIKNLKFVNAKVAGISSGPATVNGIAVVVGAMPYGGTIDNVSVQNATVDGNRYVGAIVGYVQGTVKNCTVRDVTVTATPDKLSGSYDNGDKAGLIAGYSNPPSTITGNKLYGTLNVTAFGDVAGILGYGHSSDTVTGNEICDEANLTVTVDRVTGWYDKNRTSSTLVGGGLANSADIAENNGISTTAAATVNPITSAVAQIGTVQYGTLEAATRAYQSGDTIEILGDASSMTAPEGWIINPGTPATLSVDPMSTWTKVADGFYQNAATYAESTDFYITSKEGLEYFRDLVNQVGTVADTYVSTFSTGTVANWYTTSIFNGKTVHLMADIDLENAEWSPIGQPKNAAGDRRYFYGNFDGGNHTISNLKVTNIVEAKNTFNGGLFGYVTGTQSFKDLTISNVDITSYYAAGALIGNCNINKVTIDNVKVTGTVKIATTSPSEAFAGGLVGIGNPSFSNCSVDGTSAADSKIEGLVAGGLAGVASRTTANLSTISGCSVEDITIKSDANGGQAGGLIGRGNNDVTATDNTIHDVTVSAENGTADALMAGGLASASANNTTDTNVTVISDPITGSGTQADPYIIANIDALKAFRDRVDMQKADGSSQYAGKFFKLTADIDLANENWEPIGSMIGDHGSFCGVFDGDGHTISNLNVQKAEKGLGFFAYTTGNAEIKNLTFNNVTVKSTKPTGHNTGSFVGGVVGDAFANTVISNVHVVGSIDIEGYGYVGGMVGHGYVKVYDSAVEGEGTIKGNMWCTGGIVGYAGEGTTDVRNSFVTGTGTGLTVQAAAGGCGAIVGMAEDDSGRSPISGSNLAATNVTVGTFVGGFGTSYATYCLGYLYGGNSDQNLSGDLIVNNVTFDAQGNTEPPVQDAVATVGNVIYFTLPSAVEAAQNGDATATVVRNLKLKESVAIATDTSINLASKTITLGTGVDYAFVLSGEGTTLSLANGTATVGTTGYPANYRLMSETSEGVTSYTAVACAAEIDGTPYRTFAEAIAAAEAYKTANDTYPVITVLDATAEQTNDGWMFSQDGQRLVRKVAMVTTNVDNYATTNYYASAAEAFSAAESAVANKSGTGASWAYVTLLADDTLPGDATTVLKSNHGSTDRRYIDLNGHTLTAPKGISLEYKSGGFQVYLQDGSVDQTGRVVNPTADDPEAFVFTVGSSVSLAVEGGVIVAKGEGTALKTTGGGRISLKGGSVTADPAGRALNAAGTASITAGADSSVSVTGTLGAPTGELILQGGTFTANAANGELFDVGETGSVAVSGGSYSMRVADEYIATGYKDAGQTAVVENYYTVTKEVYTITFLDENDTEIVTLQVPYNDYYKDHTGDGKIPAIPVKASDDPAFYYTGAWSPAVTTSTRATGNVTHKLTYTQGKYGFQYGDGLYTNSLANAYKAVADGGTVTVLNDAFALTSTTLNLAKDVTIDLNGSTLSMNNTGMLTVSGDGTKVTFVNGTVKYGSGTTARDALVKVTSPAEVAFEGVTLQGASYYTTAVSVASGASAAFSGECVVTMPSGKQAVTAADGGTVAISGGLYSTVVLTEYCAADYVPTTEPVLIDNVPYYTVTTMGVAKIERTGEATQYFSTLEAAIEAASAGDTVTLLADISDLSTVTVNAGQNVTLDLNGHTIEAGLKQAGRHYYAIDNYGTFTLKDSSESQTGKIRARGIENLGNGVMIVDGGIIEAIDTNGGAAIWNEGTLTMNGGVLRATHVGSSSDQYGPGALNNQGTATITKADIQSANKRAYAIISSGAITINPAKDDDVIVAGAHGGLAVDSGTATVTGGRFSSTEYYGLYVSNDGTGTAAKAQVTVSGGEFTGKTQSVHIGSDVNTPVDSVIAISGGTFHGTIFAENKVTEDGGILVSGGSFENPVPEAYCADGYIPNAEQDSQTGMYTVKTGSYVAQNTTKGVKYETLAAAIEAASAGDTVKLLADIDLGSGYVAIDKALTLDGDFTVKSSAAQTVLLTGSGDVTIKCDITATAGHGIQAGTDSAAYSGKLTVDGSTVTVAKRGIRVYKEDTGFGIVVNDSTIQSNVADPTTTYTTGNDAMALSLGTTDGKGYSVELNNTVLQGFSYCINSVTSGSNLTVVMNGGKTYGRAALNVWGSNNTFTLNGVNVNGINNQTGSSEGFSCIVNYNSAANNAYNINGCTFVGSLSSAAASTSGSTASSQMIDLRGSNATVKITGETTYTAKIGGETVAPTDEAYGRFGLINSANSVSIPTGNTIDLDSTASASLAAVLAVLPEDVDQGDSEVFANGTSLGYVPEVHYYWATESGFDGGYYDFNDPFDNGWLANGEFIDLYKATEMDKDVSTTVSFTLNLKGYTLTAGSYKIRLGANSVVTSDTEGLESVFAVPDGCCLVSDTDGTSYTYTVAAAVAQIVRNDAVVAQYASLAAAFEAAQAGDTVQLLTDCETGTSYTHGNPLVFNTANTTLDLNGKTLTITYNMSLVFRCNNGVVMNGTIVPGVTDSKVSGDWCRYGLTIDSCSGVTVSNVVSTTGIAVGGDPDDNYTPGAGPATDVVFTGCTVTGRETCYAVMAQNQSTATIKNGTYNAYAANGSVLYSGFKPNDGGAGSLTVTGGSFMGAIPDSNIGAIVISGGIFSKQPVAGLLAPGYVVTDNTDAETSTIYPWTVMEILTGDIIYPIEGTDGVPVALAWATNNTSAVSEGVPVTAANVPNIITALGENGANNMPRWKSYVLGLNPADATAVLRLGATAKDATTVTITGSVDTTKFPSISNVTVTFRLAAQNGAEWTDIATGAVTPSFDVALDDVAGKVLTIFADIVTE